MRGTGMALRGFVLLFGLLLAACGGGGGGGGSGVSLSVSPRSIAFDAYERGDLPAPVDIVANYEGDGILVGFPPNDPYVGWLQLQPMNASNPFGVRVSATTTNLPYGTYTATVRFLTGREDSGDIVIRDVPVTYTVRRNIELSNTGLFHNVVQGAVIPNDVILVNKDNANWDASTTADWISLVERPTATGGDFDVVYDTSGLNPGFHSANIVVGATDGTGQSAVVTVFLTLGAPALSVSPTSLSFTTKAGAESVPAAQSVTPTTANGYLSPLSISVGYGGSVTGWFSVPASATAGTPVSMGPSTTLLAPGQYTATATLTNGNPVSGQPVGVVYNVVAPKLVPSSASVTFDADVDAVAADLAKTVTFSDDGAPVTWTVSEQLPAWLEVLDTTGGSRNATSMRLRVRQDVIATLPNQVHAGVVTIFYGNAVSGGTLFLPVSLDLALPEVSGVMPYTGVSGRPIRHALAGSGLSRTEDLQVLIGDQPAASISIDSDHLVHFVPPELEPGTYEVRIDNALGIQQDVGKLVIVDPQGTAGEQFIATDRIAGRPVHDPARDAVFALTDSDPTTYLGYALVRFQRSALGVWSVAPVLTLPNMSSFDLSMDGEVLWISAGNRLYSLDPDDPSSNPVLVTVMPNGFGGTTIPISRVRTMTDGRVLMSPDSYISPAVIYDPRTHAMTTLAETRFMYCFQIATSYDGSRAFLYDYGGCASGAWQTMTVGENAFQVQPVNDYQGDISQGFDTDGRRIATGFVVYDADFDVLAGHALGFYPTFSPDSRRLYTFRKVDEATATVMSIYDVSVPPVRAEYPLLDQIDVPQAGYYPATTVSADGSTLFIGTANFSTGNGLLILPLEE